MPDEGLGSRFARHLAESRVLLGSRRIVVACSGGGDSTALLVLLRGALDASVELVAAHVAHGLRGPEGERDARAASDLSAGLGIPFALRKAEVNRQRRKGESLEAAGRRLRYGSLLALASELGERTSIATGHTLDDQAETVLLNLARHSGRTRGGIRRRRADGVVRPLLPFRRAELRAFLKARGITWREDETNADEGLLRNRIRRRFLPELEGRWPGAAVRLARAAEAWTRRLDALDARIDASLAAAAVTASGPWPRSLLTSLPSEAAGRLLVRAAGKSEAVPGRAQVEKVLARLARGDAVVRESLGGLMLLADSRAVRLLGGILMERPGRLEG